MADLSDVQTALVALINTAVYPNGTGQPSVAGYLLDANGNPTTTPVKVLTFPGWPVAQQLDLYLAAGNAQISVFPTTTKDATRYLYDWQQSSINAPTLTLTVSHQTVTVGGTIPLATNPHNLVVFVNRVPYVYPALHTDTLTTIATALAALINAVVAGTSASGGVITLPSTARIGPVRVGITGTLVNEVEREEQIFQVTVWAPLPTVRDQLAIAAKQVLSSPPYRMTMPDGSIAYRRYKNSLSSDKLEKSNCYRRDLFYSVEYALLQSAVATQITAIDVSIGAYAGNKFDSTEETFDQTSVEIAAVEQIWT